MEEAKGHRLRQGRGMPAKSSHSPGDGQWWTERAGQIRRKAYLDLQSGHTAPKRQPHAPAFLSGFCATVRA